MKKTVIILMVISGTLLFNVSCKNKTVREAPKFVSTYTEISPDLILVGKDIITEVIVKPDTLGDPWEVEKVKNFNGKLLYSSSF